MTNPTRQLLNFATQESMRFAMKNSLCQCRKNPTHFRSIVCEPTGSLEEEQCHPAVPE